jgi:hypothetical protein
MRRSVLTVVTAGIVAAQATIGSAEDWGRVRLPWKGHAQSASKTVLPGDPLHPDRCEGRPAAVIAGAGLTTLIGQFEVRQSHCLGDNGGFGQGEFTFTTVEGRTIFGRYSGQLVPTFPPPPGALPESGLIHGSVCVEGGTALPGIVNDCAAGRLSPALGVLNLVTGDGTIFIDYALGLKR